jgi:hypothetical protein
MSKLVFPWIKDLVTRERAETIRQMREVGVDGEGDTARMIASACYAEWGHEHWEVSLRTNQLLGHDLIACAAEVLGEAFD